MEEQLHDSLADRHHYVTERERWTIRESLAGHHGLEPSHCLPTAGSGEAITLISTQIKADRIQIPVPTFTEYEDRFGPHATTLRLDPALNPGQRLARLDPHWADLIVICNPNNPTGGFIPADNLLPVIKSCEQNDCRLIVDEAFLPFAGEENQSAAKFVERFTSLVVIRTVTKILRCPGIRAGYLLTNPGLIEELQFRQNPWPLGQPASRLLKAYPQQTEHIQRVREYIRRQVPPLQQAVRQAETLEAQPTQTNFLLIRGPDSIVKDLTESGIAVRDARTFTGLGPGWFRVRVASEKANRVLRNELTKR